MHPMNRPVRLRLILSVLGLLGLAAPVLPAQTTPTPTPDSSPTSSAAEPKKRTRAVSNEVAAALAAVMPKYEPPKPAPAKAEDDEELPDLRETDKPRNKIVRLPEYVVREKKPPVFNESELRNKDNFAKQRYSGLNLSPGNTTVGREMLWEDERLQNKATFTDLARTGSADDPEAKRYYKKLLDETYVQPGESFYQPSSTSPSMAERDSR